MTNEEVFLKIDELVHSFNNNKIMKIGRELKESNVTIKDLNTRLIVYNNNDRIIIPTIGKGKNRKYLFAKHRIENVDWFNQKSEYKTFRFFYILWLIKTKFY